MTERLTRAERDAINARAGNRTVEYQFAAGHRKTGSRLTLVRAVIRNQQWVLRTFHKGKS